jgi:hypothetical protein
MILALAAFAAVPATAASPVPRPALTIYSHDLALVRESRSVELAGGRDTVRIQDLTERLDFSSLRLVLEGAGRVTRLAYRWDVASGDGLIDGARGRRVRVIGRGDRVHQGTLVSADGTWLVVRGDDGALSTLARSAIEEVGLAEPPGGVALRPTLEAVIEGGARGRSAAQLTYLTGGLSWSAEHVLVRRGEGEATWSAAVTVDNQTGRDFADAELRLVAGEPARIAENPLPILARAGIASAMKEAGPADLTEQSFFEYHLYTLGRPATLRAGESQSLTLIEPRAVRVTPRYLYRGGDARGIVAQLELLNSKEAGPGVPLPAGRVRCYQADPAGALEFIGESRVRHTATGEKLTLDLGAAFDLSAERRQTMQRRVSDREREYAIEIRLHNHKQGGVTVVVEDPAPGDAEVIAHSHEFTRPDAGTLRFEVPVPAGKEVTVTYTARTRS